MLNFRIARFDYLIDINRLDELRNFRIEGDQVRIGAMVRYREIETSRELEAAAPLLHTATQSVAHLPIRTRGTIGGSLAHADPAAEYPAVLVALGGSVVARSTSGERQIAAEDFFQGPFMTDLAPDELLVEVRIPTARDNQVFGFEEYSRRPGDLAIVGIAARLDLMGDIVEDARIVAFGIEESPLRIIEAEAVLMGCRITDGLLNKAAQAAAAVPAQTDVHASADMRGHLAGVLTKRALRSALSQRGSRA